MNEFSRLHQQKPAGNQKSKNKTTSIKFFVFATDV